MLEVRIAGVVPSTLFALRGLARNDPDFAASLILESILRVRLLKSAVGANVSINARMLPGVVVVSVPGAVSFPFSVFGDRVSEAEFNKGRSEAAAALSKKSIVEQWLDAETYKTSVAGDADAFQKVSLADVQRVADRLAKNPIVSVVLKPSPAAE